MRGPRWTEGVPPSKRAEGAHAAEPPNATASKRSRQRQQRATPKQRQQTSPCHARASLEGGRLALQACRRRARSGASQRHRKQAFQTTPTKRHPQTTPTNQPLPCEGLSGRRASRPPSVPKARTQRSRPTPPQASVPDNANKAPPPNNANKPAPAMRGPLWTEGVPPSKRAEGAHAAEPANATASKRSRQRQQGASPEQRHQQTRLSSLTCLRHDGGRAPPSRGRAAACLATATGACRGGLACYARARSGSGANTHWKWRGGVAHVASDRGFL